MVGANMQNRIFSIDSAKAVKAQEYGWLNAIHYMAPHRLAGVGNLCSHASEGCKALCLGEHSGQAGMVKHDTDMNETRLSRREKARRFMLERGAYLLDVVRSIDNAAAAAKRKRMKLCLRMNGSTDIAFEGIRFTVERNASGKASKVTLGGPECKNVFDHYPKTQFVDYTKNHTRFRRKLPSNLSLTLSRSEANEAECLEALSRGINVAVVFAGAKPKRWNGYRVINGDQHDLRHLDPKGKRGVVVGLSPKGRKAKKDASGFVVRDFISN
jgi:hypothetical protein